MWKQSKNVNCVIFVFFLQVGKLRGDEVKIWCISIDTATTRNDLELASRKYWDRLSLELRSEAASRLLAVVEFLSTAAKELDRRPRNVEEVGLAYQAHTRIQQDSKTVAEELEAVTGFVRVLAAWTREKLDGNLLNFNLIKFNLIYLTKLKTFRRSICSPRCLGKFSRTSRKTSNCCSSSIGGRKNQSSPQGCCTAGRKRTLGNKVGDKARRGRIGMDRHDEGTLDVDKRPKKSFEIRLSKTWPRS